MSLFPDSLETLREYFQDMAHKNADPLLDKLTTEYSASRMALAKIDDVDAAMRNSDLPKAVTILQCLKEDFDKKARSNNEESIGLFKNGKKDAAFNAMDRCTEYASYSEAVLGALEYLKSNQP